MARCQLAVSRMVAHKAVAAAEVGTDVVELGAYTTPRGAWKAPPRAFQLQLRSYDGSMEPCFGLASARKVDLSAGGEG